MRIAMAQIDTVVGGISRNVSKIKEYVERARQEKADMVIFPEMAITGYPPLDLLKDREFVKKNKDALKEIIDSSKDITVIVGFADYEEGDRLKIYNSAAVIKDGALLGIQSKILLPEYDVFFERRYFSPGKDQQIFDLGKIKIGVEICEDLWDEDYSVKVSRKLKELGAEILVNISSSPYYSGKRLDRMRLIKRHVRENALPMFYVNSVGGEDGYDGELIFDGESLAFGKEGDLIGKGKQFAEDFILVDLDKENLAGTKIEEQEYSKEKEDFNAIVLGVRSYFERSGFKAAIIGLSGGIDSALTACIAVEALGKDNVICISMPSRYSSQHSKDDAKQLAENLGIKYKVIPIELVFKSYEETLKEEFKGLKMDVTEENIQARIRGNILMAESNKFGHLVLGTGNKTEMALGYCTLYGDMSCGLSVLGDVSKNLVYGMSRFYNREKGKEIIPLNTIEKAPSAELKEDQVDPFNYEVISPLVDEIIENSMSWRELVSKGHSEEVVKDIINKINKAEYKRRQAAPGIKITKKAFGIGRRMPLSI